MAEQQQGSSYIGAPFPETEFFNRTCTLTLPASGQIAIGEFVARDLTQLSGYVSWVGGSAPAGQTPQTDMCVPAISANAGLLYGVFVSVGAGGGGPGLAGASQLVPVKQDNGAGPGGATVLGLHNTTSSAQTYTINVRWQGYVQAWCKTAPSGNTIDVGSNLIVIQGTNNCATEASFTGNSNVGEALATCVVSGTLISTGALITATTGAVYKLLNVDLRLV